MKKIKFDSAIKRLEEIVEALEEGKLSIEEALKLFEEGVRLSRLSNKILEDAERSVEILVKRDGGLKTEPFIPAGPNNKPEAED
jgi:exodeoxyribonuclease VII small subunit